MNVQIELDRIQQLTSIIAEKVNDKEIPIEDTGIRYQLEVLLEMVNEKLDEVNMFIAQGGKL